jgi:hypothetical protein
MIIPKTVTAKVAYQVFLQRSDEQQLQALKMLQKLVANNEPVTLRKRKNEFQKITKLLKAYVSVFISTTTSSIY